VRARLQGDVHGATPGEITGFGEGVNLGVGTTATLMKALTAGAAFEIEDDGAHHRVRRCAVAPPSPEVEGAAHPLSVGAAYVVVSNRGG
jgi:hypothetical protein